MNIFKNTVFQFLISICLVSSASGYYTTQGQDIIDRETGEKIILRNFGLGCWLLPEGYMWGIRVLDRPRQFESAIIDLIGEKDAKEFWSLYHDNFLIEEDIAAMKSWGVNSVRVALLASMLQPREGQSLQPPYIYSEDGFQYLDRLVAWCEKYHIGVIWDMHGAPGGQNAENISDSDGEARLWTEPEKYWPRCIDLWNKIASRYKDSTSIIGYDLLNEPLLRRYDGIDPSMLRKLYIEITNSIRTVDTEGIIFIEGDDWAQNFVPLEPMDWDPHLAIAFHSYPPTSNDKGLERWDKLRTKYNIPLWHGETGEQGPPYTRNKQSTQFLEQANVGWSWWTHKKFNRMTQPWTIIPTHGFSQILEYWNGRAPKPEKKQARDWLFEQAERTHSDHCEFLPDMVSSLIPLNPDIYMADRDTVPPVIIRQPQDAKITYGNPAVFDIRASGYPLQYQWYLNNDLLPDQTKFLLILPKPEMDLNGSSVFVEVLNSKGRVLSEKFYIHIEPFSGLIIPFSNQKTPTDKLWSQVGRYEMENYIFGSPLPAEDLSGEFQVLWNESFLWILVEIEDDVLSDTADLEYERDGIEIYIDADNSKSSDYGADEFQIRYNWNDPKVYAAIGDFDGTCSGRQVTTDSGYRMEIEIPWHTINGAGMDGGFLGLDIHVNDNDGLGREAKLTWFTNRDNSYQSPSYFGTVRLRK